MTVKKTHSTIKPYTKYWEKLANNLARTYSIIHPCQHCGHPVRHGYCCGNCDSNEP